MENTWNEDLERQTKELNLTNLRLNQELLENQKELDKLKIENLKLQNNKLKYYILYSIISFLAGAIISKFDFFIKLIEKLFSVCPFSLNSPSSIWLAVS